MQENSSTNRLFYMPRHQSETDDGRRRGDASATIMLHPFQPRILEVRSLVATTARTDRATADHESYCSAPPLILPPRPSRDQEVRRPRDLIWMGKREPPESEAETVFAFSHADAQRQARCGDVSGGLLQRPPRSARGAGGASSSSPRSPGRRATEAGQASRFKEQAEGRRFGIPNGAANTQSGKVFC